jgi:hypothetical protein
MNSRVSSAWPWVRFGLEAVLALFLLLTATVSVASIWSDLFSHSRDSLIRLLLGPILLYCIGIGIVVHLVRQATGRNARHPRTTHR